MDVCVGRIHELKKKIAELQSYLDRGEPVLRLSQDLENAPEIFTCPITFVSHTLATVLGSIGRALNCICLSAM